MLAIGGDDLISIGDRLGRTDLRRLLAQGRRPQAEFALALQGGRLGVEPAGEHHVAQAGGDIGIGTGELEVGVIDAVPRGIEQLDEIVAGNHVSPQGQDGAIPS